jgi:16S rRNA (uracil1498-N3)-methyltransferase
MNLRSLPRLFVPGASADEPFELPPDELDKLRKVLRLSSGAEVAVLPNDGSLLRCRLEGREAVPIERLWPDTEPKFHLTLAQALPKGDKLETIVRSCTEIGVSRFVLFAAERTVVQWDEKKLRDKLRRYETIAREESEVSYRTRVPTFEYLPNLKSVLEREPHALVLSEVEGVGARLARAGDRATMVVGPEGGWAPRELALIGDRGVTLGPRVLRVEHAGAAAAALLLLA